VTERVEGPLAGRTVLVTGAGRGIGRAAVVALSGAGARVGLVARSREVLKELAREIGGWALPCDLSSRKDLEGLTPRFREVAGGPPDILVTAAGVFSLAGAATFSTEELDAALEVNLKGSALLVRAFLPDLLERGSGTLILIGSAAGRRALPGNAVYGASKFGLRGFHEVLLEELQGTGVRATLVEPSATDTSLWDPLDPDGNPDLPDREAMLRPEDVAEGILWVATRPPGVQVPFLPMERT
jgi:NADP-dependent 3-hydroxy acid dehydrogenase YdfG